MAFFTPLAFMGFFEAFIATFMAFFTPLAFMGFFEAFIAFFSGFATFLATLTGPFCICRWISRETSTKSFPYIGMQSNLRCRTKYVVLVGSISFRKNVLAFGSQF